MMTEPKPHPAKFSDPIVTAGLRLLREMDVRSGVMFDPFAGTGTAFPALIEAGFEVVGMEVEPEWACQHPAIIVGDVLSTPLPDFDVLWTSPCYGNRMADHHEAKDDSKRHTYRHYLERPLSEGSSAGMQWGKEYRRFHTEAWARITEAARPGTYFVLNTGDHIRKGERVRVTEWHVHYLEGLGWRWMNGTLVETRRQRHGTNGNRRVPYESVDLLRLVGTTAGPGGLGAWQVRTSPPEPTARG